MAAPRTHTTSARLGRLAAAAVVVAALAACGASDDSDADVRSRIAGQLRDNGLSKADASCVAKVLLDELGKDAIQDVDLSASEPEAGFDDEIAAAALSARTECDVELTEQSG